MALWTQFELLVCSHFDKIREDSYFKDGHIFDKTKLIKTANADFVSKWHTEKYFSLAQISKVRCDFKMWQVNIENSQKFLFRGNAKRIWGVFREWRTKC